MSNIGRWLEQHDLGEFSAMFEEERVEFETLPDLTEQDLKDLGLPLGSRKKLLRAIEALGEDESGRTGQGSATVDAPSGASTSGEAQRRQLTVMFCDLVGSTQLSGELDLESYRNVLSNYQDAARVAISRYDGFIARYMGDGLLVYFGYPQAHEDDAERAVRAALDIADEIPRLKVGLEASLSVRIGIATGQVVAGDIVGEGASEEHAVLGETPNLAARLQGVAEPNAIVISESTRHLVEGRVELAPLGFQELKGLSGPVPVYRAIAVRDKASRFEAAHGGRLTPLRGRDSEQALLLQRWEQACSGEGQVVFIEGEPGIGKSRLLQGLREEIVDSGLVVQRYQCSPYYTSTPFYPAVDLIERAAGLSRDDDTDEKLDKLSAAVTALLPGDEQAPALVAALCSLPVDRFAPLGMTPQKQRLETIRVLVAQLEALASSGPVLMLFEDAHWCDPSTLEMLGSIIDRIQTWPVLMLVAHRPEFTPPWTGYGHTTTYSLNRLGRDAVSAVIDGITGGKALPREVMDRILEKTDGVPLFVEELTKTVLESGILTDSGDHWRLGGSLPTLAIPSTLQDSLVSRLDRLAPVKEVAQIGACIGREFGYELLAAVSPIKGAALQRALAELVRNQLVFRRGEFPDAAFSFKHALVQDAAKGTLLPSRLQQIHLQIANSLLELYPEVERIQPELLAYHFTEGGLADTAMGLWKQAGDAASRRSANPEAIAHLTRALELLEGQPHGRERDQTELELQTTLGPVLMASRGYGTEDVHRVYKRAYELCNALENDTDVFSVLWGLRANSLVRADFQTAKSLMEDFLSRAEGRQDPSLLAVGHAGLGVAVGWLGEFESAITHQEQSLVYYDPARDRDHAFRYGQDTATYALCTLPWSYWVVGRPERALEMDAKLIESAEAVEHPFTLTFAHHFSCWLRVLLRDVDSATRSIARFEALASEHGFPLWAAYSKVLTGWVSLHKGKAEDAVTLTAEGMADADAVGSIALRPSALGIYAQALAMVSKYSEALEAVDEALQRATQTDERWYLPELLRTKAELLDRTETRERDIEALLDKGLSIAREQGALSWELRLRITEAKHQRRHDGEFDLHGLRSVMDRFNEGYESSDFQEARRLLSEFE